MTENEIIANSYDAVPYEGTHMLTHPFRLEAGAILLGIEAQPIRNARVLELGSAMGENLIPMAASLPETSFLGIDLSQGQVDEGNRIIEAAGLKNIQLRQADIMDIDESWGQFDYIICHGVYSWVPAPVRDKILEVCKRNLAANGVALVSYNVFPGWHLKRIIRDVAMYHTSQFEDPKEQIAGAKKILRFMTEVHSKDSIFGQIMGKTLGGEQGLLSPEQEYYLFHEFIETVNEPCLFYEFAEAAQGKGLQYVGDAHPLQSSSFCMPPKTLKALERVPLIRKEQYKDFLINRAFRSTLLCHDDIQLQRKIGNDKPKKFRIALAQSFEKVEIDIRNRDIAKIPFPTGSLSVSDRASKAMLMCLNDVYPQFIPFDELQQAAIARISSCGKNTPGELDQAPDKIAAMVLTGYACSLLELSVDLPQWCAEVSERPRASALTRLNAREGRHIANPLHKLVKFKPPNRHLLEHLNGERDQQELVQIMADAIRAGKFSTTSKVQEDSVDSAASQFVTAALQGMARAGLLIA